MSTAFQSLAAGADMFAAACLDQIALAISERRQMVGLSASATSVAAGTDVQASTFWHHPSLGSGLQDKVLALATTWLGGATGRFCLPLTDWTGESVANGIPPLMSWADLHTVASVSASGFRRAVAWDPTMSDWTDPADPMFSFGYLQPGDIIGPWILDDLQRILSACKHVAWVEASSVAVNEVRAYAASDYDCATAYTQAAASWAAAPWEANDTYLPGLSTSYSNRTGLYRFSGLRLRSTLTIPAAVFAGRPSVVDVYGWQPLLQDTPPEYPTAQLYCFYRFATDKSAGQTVTIGDFDTAPFVAFAETCPIASGTYSHQAQFGSAPLIAKYDPTNANAITQP